MGLQRISNLDKITLCPSSKGEKSTTISKNVSTNQTWFQMKVILSIRSLLIMLRILMLWRIMLMLNIKNKSKIQFLKTHHQKCLHGVKRISKHIQRWRITSHTEDQMTTLCASWFSTTLWASKAQIIQKIQLSGPKRTFSKK